MVNVIVLSCRTKQNKTKNAGVKCCLWAITSLTNHMQEVLLSGLLMSRTSRPVAREIIRTTSHQNISVTTINICGLQRQRL